MTNVDEANLLNQLMEAQERMRVAMGTISAIAIKCHPGAADIAAMFTEWRWQKKRANALDVEVEKLTARIAKLEFVAARAEDLATLGDQLWHSKGKTRKPRDHREGALRRALQALGES